MNLFVQPEQASHGRRFVVIDEEGTIMLRTYDNSEESRAVALLAAAAPDMLAALKEAAPADFADTWLPYPVWEMARAAVAKAEGRS